LADRFARLDRLVIGFLGLPLSLGVLLDRLGRDERLAVALLVRRDGIDVNVLLLGESAGCGHGQGSVPISRLDLRRLGWLRLLSAQLRSRLRSRCPFRPLYRRFRPRSHPPRSIRSRLPRPRPQFLAAPPASTAPPLQLQSGRPPW